LLIGGVARNAAMITALQVKLPDTEIVVVPESPWFEAWGAALLARDEPLYKRPKISIQQGLGTLPALGQFGDRVKVISASPQQAPPDGPMILGVDPGSTTTKAVLLDPSTHAIVASYYTRTSGDPVTATRTCLRALADQVGNRQVSLIATTGSARELVGAYLGTCLVQGDLRGIHQL
jgi:activator of 2-hydroxyglutaryl-CoA dehydratase